MNWTAISVTFQLATLAAVILLMVGLPIAYWLTFSRWRWKFVVESMVALPLVLPPTVLGFYLLFGLGPRSPLGKAFEALAGHPFPFSFEGLLIASVLYSLPFAVQPFTAAMALVDPRLVEASHSLGVSPLGTFFRVILPLAWQGVAGGAILTFAHTLGEFGVVLMVGGNIPGVTRTLSIALFDQVESLDYAAAHRTSAFLLALSFAVLLLVYAVQRRPFFRWPER